MENTKIKDLPRNTNLGKVKVRTPDGTEGWWVSQWAKGVWIRKEKADTRVHPIFVESLTECEDWEVLEVEK